MSTLFPKWTNHLPTIGAVGGFTTLCLVVALVWYYFTPKFWEVGYMPTQPVLDAKYRTDKLVAGQIPGADYPGFSHLIHAGKLGMDCRYCHTRVESSSEANIPPVATCYGCHAPDHVNTKFAAEERVRFVRDAYEANQSLIWQRVHKLPDYVRNFPHDIHLNAGVSCYSCHGMIARMPVVHQEYSLSMRWCLDCHRDPESNLVPPSKVTDLFWVERQLEGGNPARRGDENSMGSPGGAALLKALAEKPLHLLPQNCGACHY